MFCWSSTILTINQSSDAAGEGEAAIADSQSPFYPGLSPLFSSPSAYAAYIPTSSILSTPCIPQVLNDYADDSFDVELLANVLADNVRRDTRDLDELLDEISCDLADALTPELSHS